MASSILLANSLIDQCAANNLLSQRAADNKSSRRAGGRVDPPFGRILASYACSGKNFSTGRRFAVVRELRRAWGYGLRQIQRARGSSSSALHHGEMGRGCRNVGVAGKVPSLCLALWSLCYMPALCGEFPRFETSSGVVFHDRRQPRVCSLVFYHRDQEFTEGIKVRFDIFRLPTIGH